MNHIKGKRLMTGIRSNHLLIALLMLGLLLIGAGCSEDEGPNPVAPVEPTVEPRTPVELLHSFQTAYETKSAEDYLALLDPAFLFLLQNDTTARFPELGANLDFAEEERVHIRLFSGEAVVDPDGVVQQPVLGVAFQHFRALDAWRSTDDPARFPDAEWAPYEVDFLFDCGQQFSTYKATGMIKVYVRAYTRMNNGKEITYYKLAGMVDLTQSGKGVEDTSLGLIKALYR